jgi:hypothetical protein
MKNRSKLFPFALTLAVLPFAGCYHNNYNPATALADNKARIQQMVQNALPKIDASSKETLDKITQLSLKDPAKASALVGDLTDNGPAQAAGIITVAQSWFAKDPHAATDWLNTLPHGNPRDAWPPLNPRDYGVEVILPDAVSWDPSAALELANSISVPFERISDLNGVVALWAKTGPAAATAAVQSAKLTDIVYVMYTAEQERQNLLRTIQAARPPTK